MLEQICDHDAVNCATSLLEGEILGQVNVNTPLPGFGKVLLLHYAAKYACPEVIQLFLSRGAQTDIKFYDPLNLWGVNGLLPLEIALDVPRYYLSMEIDLLPEPSTFQLIASLCLPYMGYPLKAVELLASSSENVEKTAYYYAKGGNLVELAVLLTVARKKALAPIAFSIQDGDDWHERMTLHQWLKKEFQSLHIEYQDDWNEKPFASFAKIRLTCLERKKRLLKSIALLLEVFGKAGNAIEEYIKLERHSDDVKKDVALRLVEAGFRLKDEDFDFNIDDWLNPDDSIWSLIEYQGTRVPFSPPRWRSPTKWNSLSGVRLLIFTIFFVALIFG
ncbi:hypothetical protein RHMOL_Rhmol11G0216200 [Rhododendron molle]|uniref:Uncharacterized protein n=1 Tax=Rhododendron molle TaxID=49168 RepID=A0ACC0LWC5_RHOML|nr:hypothetical protein RHMOL_Rhmol11G0216200 [Rhododendron molle]